MVRLLDFVVQRAIEGRDGELKEYLLGIEVFDRQASFDPRIVRVVARRLRAKLKRYYETERGDDAVRIEIPTGAYAPRFRVRGAKAAALRALAIDPLLAEAHASLGQITSLHDWDWPKAGDYYRRAIELKPGYVTAHHWYSCDYLALLGRFDEAVAEIELAARLDPLSAIISESVGYVLMLARRYDQALEKHRQAIEIDPLFYKNHTAVGRIYIHEGTYGKAVAMLEKGRALTGRMYRPASFSSRR